MKGISFKSVTFAAWQRNIHHSTMRCWALHASQWHHWLFFKVTKIDEEVTDEKDETGTVIRILYFFLDVCDLRDVTWHNLKPNGFTEPSLFNDFPKHEHKGLLHVRRRRWLDRNLRNVILESLHLVAEGTNYSVEFANFLKKYVITFPTHVASC